jgi:hypothetical protein
VRAGGPCIGDPTWHADVAPLLAARCGGCHAEGGIGLPLQRYADAARLATAIADAVASRRMPPWLARSSDGCAPPWGFVDDPSLTDAQIALLQRWADLGAPEGDPATAAPLHVAPAPAPLDADELLTPEEGFVVPPVGDALMCASLGPPAAEDRWLLAAELAPVDPASHHGNVLVQPAGWAAPPGWWACGGEAGRARPLVFWAPGTAPLRAPAGAAIPVREGESLIVQMHWSAGAGEVAPPQIRLDWSPAPPERVAELHLLGNARSADQGLQPDPADRGAAEFRVPAGAPEHTETMRLPLGGSAPSYRLFAVGHPHAPLRLADDHPAPRRRLLARHARLALRLAHPVPARPRRSRVARGPADDELELRCTYRNTMDHPGAAATYQAAGLVEPVDVELGAGALDEMCNLLVGVVEE